MTTVTGDVSFNYAVLGDTNPWTDANVTVISDGTRTWKVASGLLTISSGTGSYVGFQYTGLTPGTTITVKAELGRSSLDGGDADGPAIIDSSGNGYWLFCKNDDIRIYRLDAWVPTQIGAAINQVFSLYDRVELDLNTSTGALVSRHEGSQLDSTTDTTYSTSLYAGAVKNRDNIGAWGLRSWAADGYAATDSITTDGATSPGVTESYTSTGFASGTPNSGTLTQGTRLITLTGVNGTNLTVPAIADQGAACLFGTDVTCTISNGTEQATDTMTWTPGAGFDYQTLASLSSDQSSLLLAWSGTAEVGGQLVFPDTWTVNTAGEVVSAPEGVETLYYISPSEGANTKYEAFNVTIGADGSIIFGLSSLSLSISKFRIGM